VHWLCCKEQTRTLCTLLLLLLSDDTGCTKYSSAPEQQEKARHSTDMKHQLETTAVCPTAAVRDRNNGPDGRTEANPDLAVCKTRWNDDSKAPDVCSEMGD
jgi:hypothetical protein